MYTGEFGFGDCHVAVCDTASVEQSSEYNLDQDFQVVTAGSVFGKTDNTHF